MKYEKFKETVLESLKDYLPEEYQHCVIEVKPVIKVNKMVDGITLIDPRAGNGTYPTIYMSDLYRRYKESDNLYEVVKKAAHDLVEAISYAPTRECLDISNARNNIVFQLINTEQNKDILEMVPHRSFQDLSIVYRLVVRAGEDGVFSSIVKNELSEIMGLTEEQLYELAYENTQRIFPSRIMPMQDVLRDLYLQTGIEEEIAELFEVPIPLEETMWVLSNELRINGSVSMLYDDNLQEIAQKVGTDLFVLPSSIHETIAISVNYKDANTLAEIVNTINMSQVDLEERLSNQVYHYNKNLRTLTLATDTPNKRLDGRVGNSYSFYEDNERVR